MFDENGVVVVANISEELRLAFELFRNGNPLFLLYTSYSPFRKYRPLPYFIAPINSPKFHVSPPSSFTPIWLIPKATSLQARLPYSHLQQTVRPCFLQLL